MQIISEAITGGVLEALGLEKKPERKEAREPTPPTGTREAERRLSQLRRQAEKPVKP